MCEGLRVLVLQGPEVRRGGGAQLCLGLDLIRFGDGGAIVIVFSGGADSLRLELSLEYWCTDVHPDSSFCPERPTMVRLPPSWPIWAQAAPGLAEVGGGRSFRANLTSSIQANSGFHAPTFSALVDLSWTAGIGGPEAGVTRKVDLFRCPCCPHPLSCFRGTSIDLTGREARAPWNPRNLHRRVASCVASCADS